MCHVIIRTGDIAAEVMAGLLRSIAMDVAAPTVSGFLLRLAPGIVAAITLRRVGSHIAARPKGAGGQTEVDDVRMMVVGTGEIGLLNGCYDILRAARLRICHNYHGKASSDAFDRDGGTRQRSLCHIGSGTANLIISTARSDFDC